MTNPFAEILKEKNWIKTEEPTIKELEMEIQDKLNEIQDLKNLVEKKRVIEEWDKYLNIEYSDEQLEAITQGLKEETDFRQYL